MSRFKEIDIGLATTIPLSQRRSKTEIASFGRAFASYSAQEFLDSLPKFLKAADFVEFIKRVKAARRRGYPFHLMMGAHVIKVGLSPLLIELLERKIVTGVSMNSAGLIHDLELAFTGKTSEDVAAGLRDGSFGMARQTGEWFAGITSLARRESLGLGEAAGKYINGRKARYRQYSLFAVADKLGIPATAHVVIGTDIVQQQPIFDAAATAEASYRDFKILANLLTAVDKGGAVANIGSSVIMPEVFLKALTVSRNIEKRKSNLTTANFDMINHYRPTMNVVVRPTEAGGKGYNFIGHHEIMIPLLTWGLISKASGGSRGGQLKRN
jgi:hypothetical protein